MTPLERITERVGRKGDVNDPDVPRPLLTLTEFFAGNDVYGSIGCNLNPPPSPAEMHDLLASIAGRNNVAEVLVQVSMFDDPEWPFSDRVWVITNAAPETVASWFPEEVRPDECSRGWTDGVAFEPYSLSEDMHPISCWWD